jgi:hypothetical protein
MYSKAPSVKKTTGKEKLCSKENCHFSPRQQGQIQNIFASKMASYNSIPKLFPWLLFFLQSLWS